jgi:citrate synthase
MNGAEKTELMRHDPVARIVASTFDIPIEQVSDELGIYKTRGWDSRGHVELMVALEEQLGVQISPDDIPALTDVAAIRRFCELQRHPDTGHAPNRDDSASRAGERAQPDVAYGLSGVVADTTHISDIDGDQGRLTYRGFDIGELADQSTFEEVSFLLLHGRLPSRTQLADFDEQLRATRGLSARGVELLSQLAEEPAMPLLRTMLSALPALTSDPGEPVPLEVRLIAVVPTIATAYAALRKGQPVPEPHPELGHAANFLAMLGLPRGQREVRALDVALLVQAEHGANASAFAARVVASTGADVLAAVVAAVGAFDGPLHGGATDAVATMLTEIGHPSRAAEYVERLRAARRPVSGFGHRVYRTVDPRATVLRRAAEQLQAAGGRRQELAIVDELRAAMAPMSRHGVDANVDLYAAALYRLLGIPRELFVPVFVAARMPGWLAHIAEQATRGVLIRPLLRYVGPTGRVPADRRRQPSSQPLRQPIDV